MNFGRLPGLGGELAFAVVERPTARVYLDRCGPLERDFRGHAADTFEAVDRSVESYRPADQPCLDADGPRTLRRRPTNGTSVMASARAIARLVRAIWTNGPVTA